MSECPYTALGVPRDASAREIKRAYRQLTQEFHPDRHELDPAKRAAKEERFKAVTAAWTVIGDADNRAAYDRRGNATLEDIFGDLFRDPPPPPQGSTLTDLFAEFLLSFLHPQPTASPPPPPTHAAWRTEPRRGVHLRRPLPVPFLLALRGGRHLFTHGAQTLSVVVPPGIESGKKLRLAGRGEPGSPPGDLFLEVEVESHPHLRRAGENLLAELPITWHELVAGGPLIVHTPWGLYPLRFLPLRLEEGHELEVPGYGVRTADHKGSLIYTVRLVQPPADAAGLGDLRETLAYLQARQQPRANLEESM